MNVHKILIFCSIKKITIELHENNNILYYSKYYDDIIILVTPCQIFLVMLDFDKNDYFYHIHEF